jgi:CubicO group peptidase (beta-lactamase class C family)
MVLVILASLQALNDIVSSVAAELALPGASVGVLHDGEEHYAYHGVTSVDNPLPVDERTLFLCGSTTKTFTATALMQFVERGLVDLGAPVRTYLPDFRVQDEEAAASVTVLQLLNHTAGWDGDFFKNTGDGDDALARYVEAMAALPQLTAPGEAVSYNNASFGVVGRLIEQLSGKRYEKALGELVLEPVGLDDSLFVSRDILTRRFAVDHQRLQDGGTTVLTMGFPGSGNAIGGLATTPRDLVAWARFHLENGLRKMQEPTVHAPGWSQGDAVGIGWLLSEAGGLRVVGHGGATAGQLSLFKMVPERNFALVSCTNCSPIGSAFNERMMRWAWETLLDAPIREPETAARSADEVTEFCGLYETVAYTVTIAPSGEGFSLEAIDRPEMLAELGIDPEPEPPIPFLFLDGDGDRFICLEPPHRGSTGFFLRDGDGAVTALNAFGRHTPRTG